MLRGKIDKNGIGVSVVMMKEGDYFVCYCPALNLATQGTTYEQADKAFDEAFGLFIEEVLEAGTLEKVLKEHGWRKVHKKWVPPTIIDQRTKKIAIPA